MAISHAVYPNPTNKQTKQNREQSKRKQKIQKMTLLVLKKLGRLSSFRGLNNKRGRGGGNDKIIEDETTPTRASSSPVEVTPPSSPSSSTSSSTSTVAVTATREKFPEQQQQQQSSRSIASSTASSSLPSQSLSLTQWYDSQGSKTFYNSLVCPQQHDDVDTTGEVLSQRFMLRRQRQYNSLRIEPKMTTRNRFTNDSDCGNHPATGAAAVLGTFHYLPNNETDMLYKDGNNGQIAAVISKKRSTSTRRGNHYYYFYEIYSPRPLYTNQTKSGPVLYLWATVCQEVKGDEEIPAGVVTAACSGGRSADSSASTSLKFSMTMNHNRNDDDAAAVVYTAENLVPSLWKDGLPRVVTIKKKHSEDGYDDANCSSSNSCSDDDVGDDNEVSEKMTTTKTTSTTTATSSTTAARMTSLSPSVATTSKEEKDNNHEEETRELVVYPNVDPSLMVCFIAIIEEMIPFHNNNHTRSTTTRNNMATYI